MSIDSSKTKKCILPWIHFNVETNGDVFPCCQSNLGLEPLGNLNNQTISEIRNGDKFIKLRQQMIDGVEPEFCKGCYRREYSSQLQSKRIRENLQWQKFWSLTDNPIVSDDIFYVDIRYSNVCNFKCRSCDPSGSHSIAAEQQKLGLSTDKTVVRRFDSTSLFEMLDKNINNLEEIYFVGGEPLLMEEHYTVLDKLIAAGNTSVRLRYNTNLSKFDFKTKNIIDYWNQFDTVLVNASLDHYGERLEYIRHGADWIEIEKNLKALKQIPSVKLQIHWLLSVFNATDIFKIFQYYVSNNIIGEDEFFISVLESPYCYSVHALHPSLKLIVEEEVNLFLKEYTNMNSFLKENLIRLKNYIHEADAWSSTKEEFSKLTSLLDRERNENFEKTFPHLKVQIHG
jgi:radical SAM protein with 4Fe4S-binding SPASM domain